MKKSILQCAESLASGELTAVALANECLQLCSRHSNLNAFSFIDGDQLVNHAELLDTTRKSCNASPLLGGIPISIKDNFATKNIPTTAGSKILEGHKSLYDATVVEKLKLNQALIPGKCNMDEFGMGSSSLNCVYGPSINPWSHPKLPLSPGGSSGGGAVAVSAGLCHGSIGSDTGGSIRQPASFCGIVGFKPTYGAISRHGLISYASSMDTPGILSPSVLDTTIIYDSISGVDERDPTQYNIMKKSSSGNTNNTHRKLLPQLLSYMESSIYQQEMNKIASSNTGNTSDVYTLKMIQEIRKAAVLPVSLQGIKIGVPKEFHMVELDPKIAMAWLTTLQCLQDAGATCIELDLPSLKWALPCYYIIACAEAASNLARYDGIRYGYRATSTSSSTSRIPTADAMIEEMGRTRGEGFGPEVLKRILVGNYVLSESTYHEYYSKATHIRNMISHEMKSCLQQVDVLIGPTVPILPFPLDFPPNAADMLLNDIMTVPANLVGLPAISLPVARTELSYSIKDSNSNNNHNNKHHHHSVSLANTSKYNEVITKVPIGIQLIGSHLGEAVLLKISLAIEQRIDFFNNFKLNL